MNRWFFYGLAVGLIAMLAMGCDYRNPNKNKKQVKRAVKVQVDVQKIYKPQPCVDLPCQARYRNPDGRCVHCAWAQLLEQMNMHEMAEWWWKNHGGGENASGLLAKANAVGLKIAMTTSKDMNFVEWSVRTGRGCLVNDKPGHVRTFVGMDPPGTPHRKVYINDNNGPCDRIIVYDRDMWYRDMWRGWAATPVYNPAPPRTKNG